MNIARIGIRQEWICDFFTNVDKGPLSQFLIYP